MDNLPKQVPLSTATTIAGRSTSTLRRWIRKGVLRDLRPPEADRSAPVMVSTQELRNHLVTLKRNGNHPRSPAPVQTSSQTPMHQPVQPPTTTTDGQVVALERLVNELSEDKARLLSQVSQLQNDLSDVRQQLGDCQQARSAVERELVNATRDRDEFHQAINDLRHQVERGHAERADLERQMQGGVRGLLRGAVKRFRR